MIDADERHMGVMRSLRGSFLSWRVIGGFLEEEAFDEKGWGQILGMQEGRSARLRELWGTRRGGPHGDTAARAFTDHFIWSPVSTHPSVHCWLPNLYTQS